MKQANINTAHILGLGPMSVEERITAFVFQGLVNRAGARVFCKAHFWNWPDSDGFWLEYLATRKGGDLREVTSLPELIRLHPAAARGLVVWDPKLDQTRWIACNMASLRDLLPVSPECVGRYGDLPVVEDLRGRFSSEIDAARWSAANLQRECNPMMGFSVEHTWSGLTIDSLDYAVQQKAFIYRLAHGGEARDQIELAHAIQSKIGPVAPIFGWGNPEEDYCQLLSFHNNFVMCAEAPNLSFWAHVPCERTDWAQPARRDPASFILEDTHYIALCTSEGDTPKMAVSVQGGAWVDPNRGRVPVNWGMNPLHLKFFPAILEYYWDNATGNDYFMGGASGAGYTYPNRMPDPEPWMRLTGEYFARADMSHTDAWMHFSRPVYELYAKVSGLRAFSLPCGPFGASLLNGGEAVAFFRGNSGLNYFDSNGSPKSLAEQIMRHCWKRPKPSFSVAHLVPDSRRNPTAQGGWNPSLFVEARDRLGAEFKIVTMQQLAELAITALKSGKLIDCHTPGYSEWDTVA